MVTFEMPVNLTQLSPDIERVRVSCWIASSALPFAAPTSPDVFPKDESPVVLGQVVKTMTVLFPIPTGALQDPIGKTAEYMCLLMGFSKSLQRWDGFSETSTVPAFRIKPTPAPIQGTFVW